MKLFGITLGKKDEVKLKAPTPQKATPGKRTARSIIRKIPKREVSYEIKDITLALQMAQNPDNPDRNRLLKIYSYILKDGHLKSQIRNARFEVLSEPWMVYTDDGKPDLIATKSIQKLWTNTLIAHIFDAELYGFTVVEGDNITPEEGSIGGAISIDREYISIEKQWLLIDGNINSAYLDYAPIMEELELMEFGDREDLGILLECSYNVIWKYYSRSDWSRGSEKFGMPILAIEADTNNDGELDALEDRAANFGNDGYIVTQAGDKVTIIERKGDKMHTIYLDNISLCNDEMSKIINGTSTTSDSTPYVGNAQVGERTMQTFTIARLQKIADEFNKSVIPYLIRKGFKLEGKKFDYPELIRQREKKMNGGTVAQEPPPPPTDKPDPKPDPKPNPKPKK